MTRVIARSNSSSVGEGICVFLENIIQESSRKNYCSCFLIKTQLELAAEGNELYDLAAAKLAEIEALFQSYLEKEFNDDYEAALIEDDLFNREREIR